MKKWILTWSACQASSPSYILSHSPTAAFPSRKTEKKIKNGIYSIWLIIFIFLFIYLIISKPSENLWICHTVSASFLRHRVWSESVWNKYYLIVLWNGKIFSEYLLVLDPKSPILPEWHSWCSLFINKPRFKWIQGFVVNYEETRPDACEAHNKDALSKQTPTGTSIELNDCLVVSEMKAGWKAWD